MEKLPFSLIASMMAMYLFPLLSLFLSSFTMMCVGIFSYVFFCLGYFITFVKLSLVISSNIALSLLSLSYLLLEIELHVWQIFSLCPMWIIFLPMHFQPLFSMLQSEIFSNNLSSNLLIFSFAISNLLLLFIYLLF